MKGIIGTRLGLVVAVAAVVAMGAGLLGSSSVSAQDGTIAINSATAAPGAQASVELEATGIAAPGLGAWTIDIIYDPAVLTAESCSPEQGGVCNTAYGSNTVRVSGASANGVQGDNLLATIAFRCDAEGSSSVTPTIDLLVDATIGDPQPLTATTQAGSVTCQETPPTSTAGPTDTPVAPAPTATTVPVGSGLPGAGTGIGPGADGGGTTYWIIAGLTGAGLAWLFAVVAGAGLATVSSSRSGATATGRPGASRDDAGSAGRGDGIPKFVALRRRGGRR